MSIQPRTAVVTIYGGDYLDRIRHLEQRAAAAHEVESGQQQLLAEVPEYLSLAQEHDALVMEAEAQALHITVQALPRKVWKALVAAHPPRTENAPAQTIREDAAMGVNEDAFKEAVVVSGTVDLDGVAVPYRSVVDPDLTAEDLDLLADIDFDRLYFAIMALNRGAGADPKASLVSRLTPKNDETSSKPDN